MKIIITVDDNHARHLLNEILEIKVASKGIVVIDDNNARTSIQELVKLLEEGGIMPSIDEASFMLTAPPRLPEMYVEERKYKGHERPYKYHR